MNKGAKELKKPYELHSKNERLLLGFLQDSPKQYTEIISHLKTLNVNERTANNIIKRLEKDRKIFRIKKIKNNRIFYRLNDFPDEVNGVLLVLSDWEVEKTEEQIFINKFKYNIMTLFPKYGLRRIHFNTILDVLVEYPKFQTDNQQFLGELIETLEAIAPQSFPKL